jgi:cullin-associated NEDD8-dissociated protein 1
MHLSNRFKEVNDGIEAFVSELQNMGLWDNVALIQVSDFARTLNPNSGDGTDHAWGGNYMLLGGSVKGGQILGEYPHDLTDDGPLTLGRGRMIPTTPWDAVFHGIATWLGVPESEMTNVVPNIQNFESSLLFSDNDMFNGPPRSDVTPSRHLLRGRVPAATDTTTAKP